MNNVKEKSITKGIYTIVTLIFAVLTFSLAGLTAYYWSFVMEPRLKMEASVQAKFLAQSQAGELVTALSSNGVSIRPVAVIDAMDRILLFSDPVSQSPIFTSVGLEVDYETVRAAEGTLNLRRGLSDCAECFPVNVALYSKVSDELIGVALIQVSGKFFQLLRNDVRSKLLTVAVVGFVLLILVWFSVMKLIKNLNQQISQRLKAQSALAEAVREQEAIMAAMPDIFYVFDLDGHLLKWNRKMEILTGLGASELQGKHISSFVPTEESADMVKAFKEVLVSGIHWIEGHMLDKNGEPIPYHFSGVPITDDVGRFIGLTGIGRDISESKRAEEALKQLATKDSLTGLYNRRYFTELGEKEIVRAQRYHHPLVVLMIDIDHFKKVNDTYGHATGDDVLVLVADIFQQTHREIDLLGRIGGEEFAMIFPDTEVEDAVKLAERLRQIISRASVVAEGKEVRFTISVGLSALRADDGDLKGPLKRADKALYEAKNSGRNRVVQSS